MKILKKLFIVMLAFCVLALLSSNKVSASTTTAQIVGGVDYSGYGTVIEHPESTEKETYVSGDYCYVPVYYGQYEADATDYWIRHKWSDWGVNNNKTNADFTEYNGTDTATEYDVQHKLQYRYGRDEKIYTFKTLYHTTYQGTKWYNKFIRLWETSWEGYGGYKANYKIVEIYTTESITTEYQYKTTNWCDSKPFSWPWENSWETIDIRTTYRYRSRTLNWNENSNTGYEKCPLNYTIDKTTNGSYIGCVWTVDKTISKKDDRNILQKLWYQTSVADSYTFKYYYVSLNSLVTKIYSTLVDQANGGDNVAQYLHSNAFSVAKDGAIIILTEGIKSAVKKFGKAVVFAEFSAVFELMGFTIGLCNAILQDLKQDKINSLKDVLDSIDWSKDHYLLIEKYTHQDCNYGVIPYSYDCVNIRVLEDENITVSMQYDPEFYNNGVYTNEYYGKVTYIDSFDVIGEEINDCLSQYDILNWIDWIN